MKILVLNSGSSSQKSALFDIEQYASADPIAPLWEGKLEWDGNNESLSIRNSQGETIREQSEAGDRRSSIEKMLGGLWSGPTAVRKAKTEIVAVGHRIVHGGPKLTQPTVVTAELRQAIADVSAIAPLHNQAGLQGIDLIEKLLPKTPQIAVFDTGFHHTLPLETQVYPGPYEWYERGIRRYGFHGINHQYCVHRAAALLGRDISSLKIVTCHLGNGCSLAAIVGGKSVDTTMGFTPLEGLMMGTRSGSIDPGILTHLVRNGNDRAKLAFAIFVHRLQSSIGSMAASLGGVDILVFTAGIGENSPDVRRSTCEKLSFLGIQLDDEKNSAAKPDVEISPSDAKVRVLVIRAQEDWAIAKE